MSACPPVMSPDTACLMAVHVQSHGGPTPESNLARTPSLTNQGIPNPDLCGRLKVEQVLRVEFHSAGRNTTLIWPVGSCENESLE